MDNVSGSSYSSSQPIQFTAPISLPLKYISFNMAFMRSALVVALAGAVALVGVKAESHTVSFTNKCGYGYPVLRSESGAVLSTGGSYTIGGELIGAIAYLQTGSCGDNGEGCTMVETTLKNPTTAGSGSSTDITLISPHAFSVATGFGYYDGCDGAGADCTSADCSTAFHVSTDTNVQVACQVDNVNLAITFCD